MGTLRESLYLPGVRAELVAHKSWWGSGWRINFVMSGPDNRYLDATAILGKTDIPKLITVFEIALEQMEELKKDLFQEPLKKRFGVPGGEVFKYLLRANKAHARAPTKTCSPTQTPQEKEATTAYTP